VWWCETAEIGPSTRSSSCPRDGGESRDIAAHSWRHVRPTIFEGSSSEVVLEFPVTTRFRVVRRSILDSVENVSIGHSW